MTIINESGLYSLVLSSKLPGAKKFRRWVTAEVLPAIRKHGVYMTPHTLEQALLSPDFLLRLAQRLKEEQEGRRAAERDRALLARELAVQQPKIDYFNELVERNLLLSLRETAKLLSVGGKGLHPLAAGKPVPVPGEERETAALCHAAQQRMLRGKGMV